MTNDQIAAAEAALIKLDATLGALIKRQSPVAARHRPGYFEALCRAIIGQQVSVASAAAIFGRLEAETALDPARVAIIDEAQMKHIGLSRQKLSYLHDLARHFSEQPEIYERLETQTDEEVIAELTAVKGIGVWTAQMFLIFTLGRPDVFAPDDIGLQRAMKQLYDWETVPIKAELAKFAERWAPYRSVACLHLWESLHNNPV